MPSLKDLRNRIASVKATQKITKAMQMVAAAKLRRAQTAAEAARPYAQKMEAVLANLGAGVSGADAPRLLAGTGSDQVHLLIVCTAERGLCGAFNSSIARLAREHINRLQQAGKTVKILCVGRKGYDILKRQYERQIVDLIELRAVKQIGYANADEIGQRVMAMFANGEFDVATLFYSQFRSVISQIPTAQRVIPAEIPASASPSIATYDYEPDEATILSALLPRNISVQVFRALLENAASEQGARMSAMTMPLATRAR
jgi:F-type H+-transporting ATPase subunit gamma